MFVERECDCFPEESFCGLLVLCSIRMKGVRKKRVTERVLQNRGEKGNGLP